MRNVIGKLDDDISDPNYPLEPEVTEQGRIFAYSEGYDTVIYGRYSTAGKIVYFIGVLLIAAVALILFCRIVRGIVFLFAYLSLVTKNSFYKCIEYSAYNILFLL